MNPKILNDLTAEQCHDCVMKHARSMTSDIAAALDVNPLDQERLHAVHHIGMGARGSGRGA